MKRILIPAGAGLLASLGFAAVAFSGGTNGTVTGVVTDINTGAAISGATITYGRTTATTNSSGAYSISIAAGNDALYASATNYLKTSMMVSVPSGGATTNNFAMTANYGSQPIPAANMNYTVLAWNNLGMHCDQDDYSYFCVLPPYNTLVAQVLNRSSTSGPVSSGITVSYAFAKKTDSTLHTNFWTYAPQFGWNLPPNVGLTGNGLSGNMTLQSDGVSWTATAIPITPYDDDGTWDPYGPATITVKNTSGTVLTTTNVAAPVSTEMNCGNCHGTTNLDPTLTPGASILNDHDLLNGTHLYSDYQLGTVHLCGSCHKDNALGTQGTTGVEELSYAMHNWHKDKMTFTTTAANTTPDCYNCHPGAKTQCLRGIMAHAGKSCHDCHGTVANVAGSISSGRTSWAQEPTCGATNNWGNGTWGGACHDSGHYTENANTLYRDSLLKNGPNSAMNNVLYCEACHNGTHAEYTQENVYNGTTLMNGSDTSVPQTFQGDSYWIHSCTVCHTNKNGSKIHQ
ncbi:MAG: carboxypeptidase-like regulatory domain-containing protein [Desulfobacteraceae bacterium]|nr:carboxypeptidase-like regulatory domain-containing protein [Desulfobacteraceae bacterium]